MEKQNQQYYGQEVQEYPHMKLGDWLKTYLIMLIPIAGFVFMFIWAFGSNVNPSKKTFFQAQLIMSAIVFVIYIVIFIIIIASIASSASHGFNISNVR